MEDDQKLWERIRAGDTCAVKVLHERYYYQLYFFGKKICQNHSVLDETVSDCFIKLWIKRNDLIISRSVKSYLFLMLRNGLIDHHRKKNKTILLEDGSFPDVPDEEMLGELDRYAMLYNTLERLPEQRRR
ncbi:MAG TPA: sigma factor, partial [Prolixibacteraceae bacterium]|nr:sigma factor [Prolixibacteraceae bacterium]